MGLTYKNTEMEKFKRIFENIFKVLTHISGPLKAQYRLLMLLREPIALLVNHSVP